MARDNHSRTALHLATLSGVSANIKALLEANADVTAKTKNGRTPLQLSIVAGTSIKPLITAGADINVCYEDGGTPLHWVAKATFGTSANLHALIAAGANTRVKDHGGKTPWDYAENNEKLKGTKAYWKLRDASNNS